MAKRAAIVQSSYIPWKGYFEIINDVDIFVFYDTVQYSKRSWINRNRIKSPLGTRWISVPVRASTKFAINETLVSGDAWKEQHFSALRQSYSKCDYWDVVEDLFAPARKTNINTISELNQLLVGEICQYLGISTQLLCSSSIPQVGSKSERLISIMEHIGADSYLSGPAAKSYIGREFHDAGIELCWKNYEGYPEYPQPHGEFDHHVSIVDLIASQGPKSNEFVFGWRENSNIASFTVER
jgi:hypothetical protein